MDLPQLDLVGRHWTAFICQAFWDLFGVDWRGPVRPQVQATGCFFGLLFLLGEVVTRLALNLSRGLPVLKEGWRRLSRLRGKESRRSRSRTGCVKASIDIVPDAETWSRNSLSVHTAAAVVPSALQTLTAKAAAASPSKGDLVSLCSVQNFREGLPINISKSASSNSVFSRAAKEKSCTEKSSL